MEQEFSFKEIVYYILRKWFIVAIAIIIGCGSMLFYNLTRVKKNLWIFEGALLYNKEFSSSDLEGNSFNAAWEMYKLKRTNTFDIMMSNDVYMQVFNSVGVELYKNESESANFFKDIFVSTNNSTLKVVFAYPVQDAKQEAFAKEVVKVFLSAATKAAKDFDPSLNDSDGIIVGSVSRNLNIDAYAKQFNISTPTSMVMDSLIGCLIGFILGGVLVCLIYFIDPKIKSYRSISSITGNNLLGLIDKTSDKKVVYNQIATRLDIVNLKRGGKVICITSPNVDGSVSEVANFVAEHDAKLDHKTLLLSFSCDVELEKVAKLGFKDYIENGAKLEEVISTAKNGFDIIIPNGSNAWFKLLKNIDLFEALIAKYDKVIIDLPHNSDDCSIDVLTSVSDLILIIVNQENVRIKDITKLVVNITDPQEKIVGVVLHSITNSYVG